MIRIDREKKGRGLRVKRGREEETDGGKVGGVERDTERGREEERERENRTPVHERALSSKRALGLS